MSQQKGKGMKPQTIDLKILQARWVAFDKVAHLRSIRSNAEYDRVVALMNGLIDVVGDDGNHPLAGLLDLVGDLVGEYDAKHFAIKASEPREVLRYLIEQDNLKQTELEDVVPQGNLSAILAGKRQISRELAKKLAKRFNVNVSVFV